MKFKKTAIIFVLLAFLCPLFSHAQKIGWVTDIHAGSAKKKKKSRSNIYYPRQYKKYLSKVLTELQNEGVDFLVISGDITDRGKQTRYVKRIRNMIRERGMNFVWARGNHDDEDAVEKYMGQRRSYYFVDRYGWRFIVLDDSERYSAKEGGMKSKQREWLEDLLDETESPVLAVMHYPFQNRSNGSIYKSYEQAESWFSGEGKVKVALSGHWHAEYSTSLRGVKYAVGNPLTLASRMGSYYVIDLDTLQIEAKQARL